MEPATRTIDEEVLVDRDHPERSAVAGEPSQRVGQGLDVGEHVVRELLDLPDALLAVGGEGEVDSVLLVGHDVTPSCLRSDGSRVTEAPERSSGFPRLGEHPVGTRVPGMRTHVVDHPLISHKLTYLRDENTDSPTFRRLADELVTLLAYEATREVRVSPKDITTPVAPTTGVKLARPKPLVVPILRAGLGMLDGLMRLLPTAEVGFLGMIRNEETLEASTYAERLPDDLSGRQCYVLDPMLATGGTLAAAIRFLVDRGANDITAICLLAAPEGCRPARAGAGRPRRPGHRRDRARWTRSSTTRATSSRASATRATGSTASRTDPPLRAPWGG